MLLGTGSEPGECFESNEELAKHITNYKSSLSGKSLDEWIVEHYGIKTRARSRRLPSELGFNAAMKAINRSGLTVKDIDFLILNTVTGDYKQPTTATEVQGLLGMGPSTFALEVNMPCSGSIYTLEIARSLLLTRPGSTALVIGVDKMSDFVDPTNFIMAGMFGDGAGAAVLGRGKGLKLSMAYLESQSDENRSLCIHGGGSKEPLTEEGLKDGRQFLHMRGKQTSAFIQMSLEKTVLTLLNQSGYRPGDFDKVVPHQASKVIVESALYKLGFKNHQIHFTVERYGNTSAGSILVTLDDYLSSNPETSSRVMLIGMGGGLNWGGMILES